MIHAKHTRNRELPVVAHLKETVLDQGIDLGVQPRTDQDAKDPAQQPVHSTLTEGPGARAGSEPEEEHPHAEDRPTQDVRREKRGLDVKVDQTEILEEVVLDQGIHFGVQPRTDQDAKDPAQQSIHSTLTEGPGARAGSEP